MSQIECDDCGTLNAEGATVCELCGASLMEERERAKAGHPVILFVVATAMTALLFVLPGVVLSMWFAESVSLELFWGIYVAAWVVGMALGHVYRPKEHYDLGWDFGPMGYMDNPFTYRDDIDRAHMGAGFVFVPMNLVSGLWMTFAKSVHVHYMGGDGR